MDLMVNLETLDIERRKTLGLPPALKDDQRIYPVDELIIHHSAGAEYINAAETLIVDAFDAVGWNRGYGPINRERSMHSHPLIKKETYAMAHFALHRYTKDGNPYNWRLVPLMSNWWHCVAWHAGDWQINRSSIGIEICGDYTDRPVDEKALRLIADYFRPYVARLRAVWMPYRVRGHSDVSLGSTICPGRIREQLPTLKKMIFS